MANTELVITERSNLVAIADAVRQNSNTTEEITIDGIISGINYIANNASGGIDTSDATAQANEIMSGETAYVNGSKVTGTFSIDTELATQDDLISQIQAAVDSLPEAGGSEPNLQTKTVTPTTSSQNIVPDSGYDGLSKVTVNAMPTATQATPSISVSSSGLITASATQTAGYVSAGTKSGTKQLTTKAATTYTPSTSNQTIATGTYLTGVQTIKGDVNLKAENIVSGKTIFGVTGTASSGGSSGGGSGSVETCTVTIEPDIMMSPTSPTYYYTDAGTMTIKTLSSQNAVLTVPKNSIMVILDWNSYSVASGSCNQIFYESFYTAYQITGNCTFIFSM